MRNCPYCGEQIEETAGKCPFCGSVVEEQISNEETQILDPESQIAPMVEGSTFNTTNQLPNQNTYRSVNNGLKVFLSIVATIPLIGQLVGIIMAIIYMNSENDKDRKSFGKALLLGTLSYFFITCLCCIAYFVLAISIMNGNPELFEQFRQLK